MNKRYPRGKLAVRITGEVVMAEVIELKDSGALFMQVGSEASVFIPFHNINSIEYEMIPKELLDESEKTEG